MMHEHRLSFRSGGVLRQCGEIDLSRVECVLYLSYM